MKPREEKTPKSFAVWQCDCGWANLWADGVGTTCTLCSADHKLDWQENIIPNKYIIAWYEANVGSVARAVRRKEE